jgi:hypothetical protein
MNPETIETPIENEAPFDTHEILALIIGEHAKRIKQLETTIDRMRLFLPELGQ